MKCFRLAGHIVSVDTHSAITVMDAMNDWVCLCLNKINVLKQVAARFGSKTIICCHDLA